MKLKERENFLITDSQTNFVYFSALLKDRYPEFYNNLITILKSASVGHGLLPGTNDIWCRDYMPIQIDNGQFVRFLYDPSYLRHSKKDRDSVTDAGEVCRIVGVYAVPSDIRIDGGNIIASRRTVMMTSRVIKENNYKPKDDLVAQIQRRMGVEKVILIPECPGDEFGHADGMVRFIDEDTVLISDFTQENGSFQEEFRRTLDQAGLRTIVLPYNPYQNRNRLSAKGVYINYLQVGRVVIFPTYGLDEDERAGQILKECFGQYVFGINSEKIAREGGVLNCVSWNVKI